MNKFLITLATLVAFALSSVAHADVKISGFLQQIVGAGDEVIGPIQTGIWFAFVCIQQNAIPVYVDSDPNTFLMDPNKISCHTKYLQLRIAIDL